MRLLLLCGSAAPGRDGVGDYSRRLGAALQAKGVEVRLLATHDKQVPAILREQQAEGAALVDTTRLPYATPARRRSAAIGVLVKEFKPDWVSLQYVPYSFQPKGLPLAFVSQLGSLLAGVRVHVMFHECWVGISRISPWRHRLTGLGQRFVARRLVRGLRPRLISTSNELYRAVLATNGIDARLLPLFSNIEVARARVQGWRGEGAALLNEQAGTLATNYLVAGIFGTIYPQVDLGRELRRLRRRAEDGDRRLLVVTFGRAGAEGLRRLENELAALPDPPALVKLGELPAASVSAALQLLEVAISCTPRQHLGKSGVYAAMRRHGVEVIATVDERVPEYEALIEAAIARLGERPADHWSATWVADRLREQLTLAD